MGRSQKTFENYGRHLAAIALHFGRTPLKLNAEEVREYLYELQKRSQTPCQSYFKHTVFGLRFLLKSEGLPYNHLLLPEIKKEKKLPSILSKEEVWRMFYAPKLLKHRILLGLLYGCGLRCFEARNVRLRDLDFDRKLLFQSAWGTLRQFAQNRHLSTGMIAILHTWGQTLSLHPHLHCIVPGGGTDKNGRWKHFRMDGKYLFPVKALSKVFRAKFVSLLRKTELLSEASIKPLFANHWVVYAKHPFFHPSHIIEYLGRYTHKVAISNSRIQSYENNRVIFSYKDYRHGNCKKQMELEDTEFIRRFAFHILPSGFVRIRHYGILSSTSKKKHIALIRQQLPRKEICFVDLRKIRPYDPSICPCCGKRSMVTIASIPVRGPPQSSFITTLPVEMLTQDASV